MESINLPIPSQPVKEFPQADGTPFLDFEVTFNKWFTILSGPNGVGKSTVLRKIKELKPDRTFLYNPKRNSVRSAVMSVFAQIEREGRRKAALIADKLNKVFNDTIFEPYSSFSEIIASDFIERLKTSGGDLTPKQIIDDIAREYGGLVKQIFSSYSLSDWEFRDGAPYFKIKKFDKFSFESEGLSTGEQEILSLTFNVYFFRDSYDILLIDEPEVHLNWALEENLFKFLKDFANINYKQIIVTTHSRIILDERFKDNCIFLYFDDKKNVRVSEDIPELVREQISGDIIKFVISKKPTRTIFVEDSFHEMVVKQLTDILKQNSKDINIQILNGKTAINSLYGGISQRPIRGLLKNAYFLLDGDGEKDPHPDDNRYIKLSKDSLESYFFDFRVLADITQKNIKFIKAVVCDVLNRKKKRDAEEGKIFLLGKIKTDMLRQKYFEKTDCSSILKELITKLNFSQEHFVLAYISYLKKRKRLKSVFGGKFMSFFIKRP